MAIVTQSSPIVTRLFRGERVEHDDYGITVTVNRGTGNINRMVASIGRLSTGEHLFSGGIVESAQKFVAITDAK